MKLHSATAALSALLLVECGKASTSETKRLRTRSIYKSEAGSARRGTSAAEDEQQGPRNLQDVAWIGGFSIPIANASDVNITWPMAPGPVIVKPIMAETEEVPPSMIAQPISVGEEDVGLFAETGEEDVGLFAETPTDEGDGPQLPPPIAVPFPAIDINEWVAQTYQPRWYDRDSGYTGTSYNEAVDFCSSDATPEGYVLCSYAAVCPQGEEGSPIGGFKEDGGEHWVPVVGNFPTTTSISASSEMSMSTTTNNNPGVNEESEYWVQVSSSSEAGLFSDTETCTLQKQLDLDAFQNGGADEMELNELTKHVACCLTGEAVQSIFLPEPGPVILPEQDQVSATQEVAAPVIMPSCPDTLDGMEVLDDDATLYYAIVPSLPSAANNGLLCARLEVAKEAWVAFAVSEDGSMIGSEAIIGLPDEGTVKKYNLASRFTPTALKEMEENKQTLMDTFITQEDGMTKMGFTKKLVEPGEIAILENGVNIFLHARGSSNTPGYHANRMTIKKDFKIPQVAVSLPVLPLEPGPVIIPEDDFEEPSVSSPMSLPIVPLEPGTVIITDAGVEEQPVSSDEDYDPFLGMDSMSLAQEDEGTTDAPTLFPTQEPPLVPACSVCLDGLTVPSETPLPFDEETSDVILAGMTCGEVLELAPTYLENDEVCDELSMADFICCPQAPEVPCEYCVATGGITVDGSLVIIPDEGSTCDMAVMFAAAVEGTSEDCAIVKETESDCCPTAETPTACQFCPDGLAVSDDTLIPFLNDGAMTCGEAATLAATISNDGDCYRLLEAADFVCCPLAPEVPCNYCEATGGITVDGTMPIPNSDGNTCGTAALFAPVVEGTSEECATILSSESTCCPIQEDIDVEMSMSMPMDTIKKEPTASPIKTSETPPLSSSSSPTTSPTGRPTSQPTMSPITVVKEGAKPSSAMVLGTSFFVASIVMIAGLHLL